MDKIKVYRSIKSNSLTQSWGENKAFVKTENGKVIFPIQMTNDGKNSVSLYSIQGMSGHNGHDFACWSGEPVYFSANFDGWLKHESDLNGGIGVDIVSNGAIVRDETGNLQYIKFRVWHGKQVLGQEKQQVKFGDLIMLGDSTGASGGNHVHQCLKWCDINGKGIKTGNGWQGAIPPEYFDFENTFVGDIIKVEQRDMSFGDCVKKFLVLLQSFLRK